MYVASDSHSDLPIFPLLERASRHDMLSFLHSFFTMKAYLPEFRIEKLLLDSAHDAYAVYEYCCREKEYNRRTSVERSNKREKEDYKLEEMQ